MAVYEREKVYIKPGDLLIWSQPNYVREWYKKLGAYIIRFFTMSTYYHVGIVKSIENGEIYTLEAVYPKVGSYRLRDKLPCYYISMDVDQSSYIFEVMKRYEGKKYSVIEAISAYFGRLMKRNGRLICTELVIDFYKEVLGVDYSKYPVPDDLVKQILKDRHTGMKRIVASGDDRRSEEATVE